MMIYSPANGLFYDPAFRPEYEQAGTWPPDPVTITAELFQALLSARSAGKVIQPGEDGQPVAVDAPAMAPAVPTSVSPAQARLALLGAGKLAQVEAIVAAADVPTQIAWNNASVIERASPTVAALSAALGLTDEQLDDLFATAAAIRV